MYMDGAQTEQTEGKFQPVPSLPLSRRLSHKLLFFCLSPNFCHGIFSCPFLHQWAALCLQYAIVDQSSCRTQVDKGNPHTNTCIRTIGFRELLFWECPLAKRTQCQLNHFQSLSAIRQYAVPRWQTSPIVRLPVHPHKRRLSYLPFVYPPILACPLRRSGIKSRQLWSICLATFCTRLPSKTTTQATYLFIHHTS